LPDQNIEMLSEQPTNLKTLYEARKGVDVNPTLNFLYLKECFLGSLFEHRITLTHDVFTVDQQKSIVRIMEEGL